MISSKDIISEISRCSGDDRVHPRVKFSDSFKTKNYDRTAPACPSDFRSTPKNPQPTRPILRPSNPQNLDTDPSSNDRFIQSVEDAAIRNQEPADNHPTISPQIPFGRPRPFGSPSPIISSDLSGRSLQRNLSRLQNELSSGEEMLGESEPVCPLSTTTSDVDDHDAALVDFQGFLPNDPALIFTRKIQRPQLRPATHKHSIDTIVSICNSTVPTPKASPFCHDNSLEAAKTNAALIADFEFDLQRLFDAHPGTTISPGSEFRPLDSIALLLQHHPFWEKIKHTLTKGASYDFKPLPPDSARKQENEAILDYGNHASARKRPEALIKVCKKDSRFGYSFPITFACARNLRNGRAGPLGVAQHAGIDEFGEIVLKDRLAHDQSFSMGFAPSLNDLVDDSELIDSVFGWCLDRLIHQIVAIRLKFPDKRILICKFDWGSAYQRINGDCTLVANTITTDVSGDFANILTRLSFGGRPHPAMFSVFSEASCSGSHLGSFWAFRQKSDYFLARDNLATSDDLATQTAPTLQDVFAGSIPAAKRKLEPRLVPHSSPISPHFLFNKLTTLK